MKAHVAGPLRLSGWLNVLFDLVSLTRIRSWASLFLSTLDATGDLCLEHANHANPFILGTFCDCFGESQF